MSVIEEGFPWMSPELLTSGVAIVRPTKESDIYALGISLRVRTS